MSTHHGKEFMGFAACAPPTVVPAWFLKSFFYPRVKSERGRTKFAPYGLRKIEAALIESGFDVATVHPYDIEKFPEAKVVGVSVMDPLGFGPVSVTLSTILGGTPSTRLEFAKLIEKLRKRGVRIIVGGAGAWQFEWEKEWLNVIDCIVIGEADELAPNLFEKALKGEELPKIVYSKGVEVERIPAIKNPSVNGLVEVSRGCGRGCRFCSETLKGRRDIPVQRIVEEVELNIRGGSEGTLLHAEDVLLYGSRSFVPNEEKILELFERVRGITPNIGISHCSLAAVAAKPEIIEKISELLELGERIPMLGVQTGIETGSPRLLEKYMRGKSLPFHPKEWCDVVEEAFAVMHDNLWIPAATLLICLPDEREEDVLATIELVERLKDYRSLIVPLIFIPMEVCSLRGKGELKEVHWELLQTCMKHAMRWVDELAEVYLRGLKNEVAKLGYRALAWWVKRAWKKKEKEIKPLSLSSFCRNV